MAVCLPPSESAGFVADHGAVSARNRDCLSLQGEFERLQRTSRCSSRNGPSEREADRRPQPL